MKSRILFAFLMIFCLHCSVAQIKIPLYTNMGLKECPVSEYVSSIKYIPLETKDECLVGSSLQVIVTNDCFFIHDFKEDIVFRFDAATGRFLNKIGLKGQGPGEYKRLFGIYVDNQAKKCFLLDTYVSVIHVYTYEGEFIQDIPVEGCAPSGMESIGDYYVLNNVLYTQSKKELFLMNRQGKLLKRCTLLNKSRMGFMLWDPYFFKWNNLCYYKNYLSDNIYLIDDKLNKRPVYWIDCGDKAVNSKEDQYNVNKGVLTKEKTIVIGHIKGYKDNLYIPYTSDKQYFAVYNRKTGSVFSPGKDNVSGFTDDLTNGPLVEIPYTFNGGVESCVPGQLISVLYCSEMEKLEPYNNKGEFGRILKSVNDDSNPIIRIVTLK